MVLFGFLLQFSPGDRLSVMPCGAPPSLFLLLGNRPGLQGNLVRETDVTRRSMPIHFGSLFQYRSCMEKAWFSRVVIRPAVDRSDNGSV